MGDDILVRSRSLLDRGSVISADLSRHGVEIVVMSHLARKRLNGGPLALLLAASGCLLGVGAGCQIIQGPATMNAQSQPRFQQALIIYRIDGTPTAEGIYAGATVAGQRGGKIQTLSIQYPHPKGKSGYARAELVVERLAAEAATNSASTGWLSGVGRTLRDNLPGIRFRDGVDEALGVDVPLSVVEKAVAALENQGYFSATAAPVAGSTVTIAATINGVAQSKPWRTVQTLDGIVSRVRHEGQVVSHTAPAVEPAAFAAVNAPTVAFPTGPAAIGGNPGAAVPLAPNLPTSATPFGDPSSPGAIVPTAGLESLAVRRLPSI